MNEAVTDVKGSRQEKIAYARNSFQEDGIALRKSALRNDSENPKEKKCPFCLIRMMLAGILFFVLIASFHYNVSLGEFNKKAVRQALADNTRWEMVIGQAMQFVKETEK